MEESGPAGVHNCVDGIWHGNTALGQVKEEFQQATRWLWRLARQVGRRMVMGSIRIILILFFFIIYSFFYSFII